MKKFSKILSVALLVALVLSLGVANAFADENTTVTTQTITIGNAVKGETYTAYKLMDASYEGTLTSTTPITYYYVGAETDPLFDILNDYFQFEAFQNGRAYLKVVDEDGDPITYTAEVAANLAKAINAAMNAEQNPLVLTPAATGVEATGTPATAVITVADKGYYFVNTSLGAVCSIDTADNVTINEKNTTTTEDKTVQEDSLIGSGTAGDGTNGYGDKNDADVGDTVYFKTTVTIGKGQKNVVFHDVMQTGKLAFNADSVVVTGASTTSGETTTNYYTIKTGSNAASGDTFTVEFDNDWTTSLSENTTVTITYSAVVTEGAIVGDQAGLAMDAGNDNKSRVTFGDSQSTEWDWTRTYTWSFDILKYAGELASPTKLEGAEFELSKGETKLAFKVVKEGSQTEAAEYLFSKTGGDGTTTTLVTPKSGLITLKGLDADTYTLTETKAPTGYNKLNEPITVVVDSNTDVAVAEGADPHTATMTLKQDGTTTQKVNVLNNSGTELPSTGGIGITIFYVVGGVLVLAAIILLVTKKRMSD